MGGELLSPCRCDGSVKCTHQPCLIKWISERGCWSCELCYYKYHVIAISTKNPLQWQAISLTVIEKVQIAAAILGSLFLIASISWLIWSTFSPSAKWQRQDLLFQICYGMYGFMDIVCIGLIIHEGPSVYRIFKRWQAVNQQWKVLNYDKTKDMEEQKTGTRTNQRPSSQTNHSSSTGGTATNSAPADSGARAAGHATGTLSDHHCAYTILHILSHLRPHEQRSQSSSNRELVMRVTTVNQVQLHYTKRSSSQATVTPKASVAQTLLQAISSAEQQPYKTCNLTDKTVLKLLAASKQHIYAEKVPYSTTEYNVNILRISPVILTSTGLISCILQGGKKLSSRAPQVVQQVIFSLSTQLLTLSSPVACLEGGNECLSQPGLQKLRVEQRQLLRLHQQLQTLLGLALCSLKTHKSMAVKSIRLSKRGKILFTDGRMTIEKPKKCKSEELLFCL
ncbi:hypothetical protein IHE44_0014546 [Lamprotornis superbus]|uniref:RING-type E3 ubiquitin transferase n=1 Tax=Lamprotornis superbus TaxID=245042 RepID=A0A835NZB1_9PASS|nr:hypothetical protein IHE44_0014546 [Lamprotornis superbus]